MDERSSNRKKRDHDFSVTAFSAMEEVTADADEVPVAEDKPLDTTGKNPNSVALGRLGAKKGGKAGAEELTPEQRSAVARKAARARWGLLLQRNKPFVQ